MWPGGHTKRQLPKWPENYEGELWLEPEKGTIKNSKRLKYPCNYSLPSLHKFVSLFISYLIPKKGFKQFNSQTI